MCHAGTVTGMLRPYREVLATPGALRFSAAGFVARMPISMLSLGIVLLLSETTGSYTLAGAVAAVTFLAQALAAPQVSRLVDIRGQAQVLPKALAVHLAGLVTLAAVAVGDGPRWLLFAAAAVLGAAWPSIDSLVRARWAYVLDGRTRALHTAYSLESVLDELIFVLGPVLVTFLATAVHRLAGLAAIVGFTVVGGLALSAQRRTEPPGRRVAGGGPGGSALRYGPLRLIVPVLIAIGAIFGAVEVIVVAFTEHAGHRGAAGWVLAAWAFGSMCAGIVYGVIYWRGLAERRYLVTVAVMAASVLPMPFAPNVLALTAVMLLAGGAISPMLISSFSLIEARVPASHLTESLTWAITGLSLGLTIGAATAGRAVDTFGASRAFLVPVAAGISAAVIAAIGARWLLRTAPAAG
jgi:MFS family permease